MVSTKGNEVELSNLIRSFENRIESISYQGYLTPMQTKKAASKATNNCHTKAYQSNADTFRA